MNPKSFKGTPDSLNSVSKDLRETVVGCPCFYLKRATPGTRDAMQKKTLLPTKPTGEILTSVNHYILSQMLGNGAHIYTKPGAHGS